jgi:hypothetical protein
MLKTETVSARAIPPMAVLSNGQVLIDKGYSPIDDKFIFVLMDVDHAVRLGELITAEVQSGDKEGEGSWSHYHAHSTIVIVKHDEKFEVLPDGEF